MTMTWIVLGAGAVLAVTSLGYLHRRDRRRAADGDSATRTARQRREAERHAAQSDAWNRGGHGFMG